MATAQPGPGKPTLFVHTLRRTDQGAVPARVPCDAVGRSPGRGPVRAQAGPDGALWVTLVHSGEIARVTVDGEVDVFSLGAPGLAAVGDHLGARRCAVVHALRRR